LSGFFYFWKMKEKIEYEVSIFEKKRKWYELVLAAIFYSIFIYVFSVLAYSCFFETSAIVVAKRLRAAILLGGFCITYGLKFSMTKDILIDLETKVIISRYAVGPFSRSLKSKVTEFEYVSFFKDKNDCYRTNLWYVKNRHYKMYSFEDKEAAYQFSLEISNKLNIDILDATEKGNFKWLEKEKTEINSVLNS